MKTTIDLPNDLVKKVKLHALHEGRKLKDAMADLLRKGLATTSVSPAAPASPGVKTDPKTGLPFFPSAADAPITRLSTEEIYAMMHQLQQEEDRERAGFPLRR